MAVVTAYDSGVATPLTPGPWREFLVGAVPSPAPLQVVLALDLVRSPAPTWHSAGQVAMRIVNQGQLFYLPPSEVVLIDSASTPPSGYEYSARFVLVPKTPGLVPSTRETGFRGVAWEVKRWLGTYRARVIYLD
jgi:hypothetical protein